MTPQRPRKSTGQTTRPLEGVVVLVVDDDEDARYVAYRFLGYMGALVLAVASADEALTALRRMRPDVVLTDILMPKVDGIELMRELRENPQLAEIPVIALTAFTDVMSDEIAGAGFRAVMGKPADMTTLVDTIARLAAIGR